MKYHIENETVKSLSIYFDNGMSEVLPQALEINRTDNYIEKYGSKEYGVKAYNINNFKIWSMSFCILFVWIGIYLQHKNIKFGKWIKYLAITIFIICQLIPFGYAMYVKYADVKDNTNITNNNEIIELKQY